MQYSFGALGALGIVGSTVNWNPVSTVQIRITVQWTLHDFPALDFAKARLTSANVRARCANMWDCEHEVRDMLCVCPIFRLAPTVHDYKFVTKTILDLHWSNQTQFLLGIEGYQFIIWATEHENFNLISDRGKCCLFGTCILWYHVGTHLRHVRLQSYGNHTS